MNKAKTMHAMNAISGSLAECYITMDGNRYKFMQGISVEAKFSKTKSKIPILGRPGKGNKATGWEGTGTAKFYYNTSIFRKVLKRYKETGEDIYFDMQVVNEDPTSRVGRQTVILKDCNIDSGILAKYAAGEDYLTEEMDFTFEDFELPEEFDMLEGMI